MFVSFDIRVEAGLFLVGTAPAAGASVCASDVRACKLLSQMREAAFR